MRAEGRALGASQGAGLSLGHFVPRKKQLGRETKLEAECAVIRIQTNRKSVWQAAAAATARQQQQSVIAAHKGELGKHQGTDW